MSRTENRLEIYTIGVFNTHQLTLRKSVFWINFLFGIETQLKLLPIFAVKHIDKILDFEL